MAEGTSLINIGELSKPATVLIERISDAIGGYFRPNQIRRVAKAEADAEKIKALAQIEITELQQRALRRFVAEEAIKQDNIESITSKALPQLEEDSKPQEVDKDWIINFFDKCRLVSDEDMQNLWAKVLAGEANSPGKYSKRTVNYLGSLDKYDAELFTVLCGFSCYFGNLVPLIYDEKNPIYTDQGIYFNSLRHLDEIGFLSFESLGYYRDVKSKHARIFYYGTPVDLEFPNDNNNQLDLGRVLLSQIGQEMAAICGSKPVPGFLDYAIEHWMKKGIIPSSPYPKDA